MLAIDVKIKPQSTKQKKKTIRKIKKDIWVKKRKEKIVHIGIHKHINIYINISINYCTLGIFDCLFFFGHLGIISLLSLFEMNIN